MEMKIKIIESEYSIKMREFQNFMKINENKKNVNYILNYIGIISH
jgi:hypothetical protein